MASQSGETGGLQVTGGVGVTVSYFAALTPFSDFLP